MQITALARAKNVAAWITPLVFTAIGWRYLKLIAEAATDPPYQGNNVWLIVWTAAAAIVIASIAIAPRPAFRIWSVAIASAAAAIIVLSGVLASAMIALWVLLICVLLGDRILSRLVSGKHLSWLGRITIAFPLGYLLLAFAAFALAVTGLYKAVYI